MPRFDKTKDRKRRLTARTADPYDLYLQSVQDPPSDVHFIRRVFKKERGREALSLREDFCGTAAICAEWVRRAPTRTAVGLDVHKPTLDYGMRRHIDPLGEAARRVTLLRRNVLDGTEAKSDVIAAFNFSYSVFKERAEMLRYFCQARRDLNPDGAFFIDLYGGPDAQVPVVERTRIDGFTYVWEQMPIDALTGWGKRYIHFRFPDGSEIKRAFTYDWRLWSLPELRDLMLDAGFARCDTFWEGSTEDGEGDGVFRRVRRAENEDAWIAYLVGWA